jgi:hypothetical protein
MLMSSPISAILGFMYQLLFDTQRKVPNIGIAGTGGDDRSFSDP